MFPSTATPKPSLSALSLPIYSRLFDVGSNKLRHIYIFSLRVCLTQTHSIDRKKKGKQGSHCAGLVEIRKNVR